MSDPLSNPHQLLERWIRGELDHKEEARLFAAASEDPFLAEALEGYLNQAEADHSKDLAAIRRSDTKVPVSGKQPFLLWRNPKLLGIAASLALLLGIGLWWTISRSTVQPIAAESTKENASVPQLEAAPAEAYTAAPADQPPSMESDASGSPLAGPVLQPAVPLARNEPSGKQNARAEDLEGYQSAPSKEQEVGKVEKAMEAAPVASAPVAESAEAVYTKFLIQGQVVDTEGNPVPGLALMANGTKERAGTGRDGRFTFAVGNLNQDLVVLSDQFEPVQVPVNGDDAMKIVVQRKPMDIATSDKDELKEAKSTAGNLAKRKTRSATAPASAPTVQTSSAWDKYLQKEKKNPGNASGPVVLSFSVNPNGVPTDIKVEKSLGQVYDDYCRSLLENGPTWEVGSGTRRQVRIDF